VFATDGFSGEHELYRKNTNWHKIIENAKTFIAAGGRAKANTIVFKHNEDRIEELKQFLLDYNIETGVQFPLAMHQQPVYATADRLPRAEQLASTCLSLPVHAQLTADEVRHVADLVKYFFTLPAHSVEQNTHVTLPN
jgi:dTDP-4-amino-4,6-dideoxygalactose transaminase